MTSDLTHITHDVLETSSPIVATINGPLVVSPEDMLEYEATMLLQMAAAKASKFNWHLQTFVQFGATTSVAFITRTAFNQIEQVRAIQGPGGLIVSSLELEQGQCEILFARRKMPSNNGCGQGQEHMLVGLLGQLGSPIVQRGMMWEVTTCKHGMKKIVVPCARVRASMPVGGYKQVLELLGYSHAGTTPLVHYHNGKTTVASLSRTVEHWS